MFGLVFSPFALQVVKALLQLGNSALPGVGADVLAQLRQMLQQQQLDKDIAKAVAKSTQDFVNEQKQGQAANLLQKLERVGVFKKHSTIAYALALLALNPIDAAALVEQELERQMVYAVPAAAEQCEQLAKSLINHVRPRVNAIPQMKNVQQLMYQRLSYEAMATILKEPLVPLPDHLRDNLLKDAKDAQVALQHSRLSSAHLLYALACCQGSVAQAALTNVHVTPERAYATLQAIFNRSDVIITEPTRIVERTLMWSRSIAAQDRFSEVHAQHILEALLDVVENEEETEPEHQGGRAVFEMLRRLNTSVPKVRAALLAISQTTTFPNAGPANSPAPTYAPANVVPANDPKPI